MRALLRNDRVCFVLAVTCAALVSGFGAAHRVIAEPGVVGLLRDWSVPPAPGQLTATASAVFDGWYRWTLGFPVVYPSDYILEFALGVAGALGIGGALLSKAVVVLGPALACACAMFAARRLGIGTIASLPCGFVYALSPVALNKLVSGQLTFIFGYALLPLAVGAYAGACTRRRWLAGGLATGAALGLTAIQIQLGFIAVLLLGFAALTLRISDLRTRLSAYGVAVATLLVIELPVLVGLTTNFGPLGEIRVGIRNDTAWIGSNSVLPDEAFKLAGYIVAYDLHAVAHWYLAWSIAAYAVAIMAFGGVLVATRGLRPFLLIAGAAALLFVTGVYSPAAVPILWLFAHVSFSQAFLELYDIMSALALIYALGVGLCWAALRGRAGLVVKVVATCAIAVFVAPLFSGDGGGLLRAHPYDRELIPAYERLAGQTKRTVWFPMDQPLSFQGRGAGVEPMGETAQGSLWKYSLAWPLTAVDMDARSHDWNALTSGLEALSVGSSVQRTAFDSKLYLFLLGAGRHTYLERRLAIPPLSNRSFRIGATTRIDELPRALPLAYGADGVAVVPRRLAAIAPFSRTSLVPVDFGAAAGLEVPYVVVRDAGDRPDEELDLAGIAGIALPASTIDATGSFAALAWWWWDRPEFGDVDRGMLAYGQQHFEAPLPARRRGGVVEVAWICSPAGGRFRLSVGARSGTFDTNARRPQWRSAFVAIDGVHAGDLLAVDALDPGAAVAIRAIRIVDAPEVARADAGYAALLRGARAVIAPESRAHRAYRTLRTGSESRIGRAEFGKEYRLRVRTDRAAGAVMVLDARNNLVAYQRTALPGATYELEFAGIDDRMRLVAMGPRVRAWTLGVTERASAALPVAILRAWGRGVEPDTFGGTVAAFSARRRVVVLNVKYGDNWKNTAGAARHLRTALGTNAWVLAGSEPLRVRDAQTPTFHFAYVVGLLMFAGAGGYGAFGGYVGAALRRRRDGR